MPIKKWIIQYTIALPLVFVILGAVQYLKGRGLAYAIEFGLLWATISVVIFALTRAYNFRRNIQCSLCNDLPDNKSS